MTRIKQCQPSRKRYGVFQRLLKASREEHASTQRRQTVISRGRRAEEGRQARPMETRSYDALKDIRRHERAYNLLIPRLAFRKVVREVLSEYQQEGSDQSKPSTDHPLRIKSLAVDALQEAAETYLVCLFDYAHLATIHANRVMIMPKDLDLVRRIGGKLRVKPDSR